MKRAVCVWLASFMGLVLGAVSSSHAVAAEQPNIVFFLVDDFGARDLTCYGS